jgi:hypothetical protein
MEAELKGINIEPVKSEIETVPTEEWYYYCMVRMADFWEVIPNPGKDPRDKKSAIDEAKKWNECSTVKVVKFALPI